MDNKVRIKEIEKEIDSLNIQMKSKKFDRYSDDEKKDYIQKQLKLFIELKELVGFFDKMKINTMIIVLEKSLKKV